MPRPLAVLSLAAVALAAAATSASAAPRAAALGVVTAESGTLKRGVLTLRDAAANGTWFLDRPEHRAGVAPMGDLVKAFFGPGEAPPNAALTVERRGGGRETVVVELTHPRVRAQTSTVRFGARVLTEARAPRRFGAASLFIDTQSQACQVDIAFPTTSTVVQGSVRIGSDFGTSVDWSAGTDGISASNWGEMFYGCGATLTADFQDATVPGGGYEASFTWSNPMTGTNSSSCSATASDGSAVTCTAGDVPQHGGQISFGYSTLGAPTPYSGPLE